MKRDFIWFATVLFALFIGSGARDRYQATSVGDKAFVLDKFTGEGWVSLKTVTEVSMTEICMAPLVYSYTQDKREIYVPAETKNSTNVDWNTWMRTKLGLNKKENPWDDLDDY